MIFLPKRPSACVVVGDRGYFVESSNEAIDQGEKKIVTSFHRSLLFF